MSHAAQKTIVAHVPIADFYATIVDYHAYPQITDEVKSVRTVSRDGDVAVVAYTARIMLKSFEYTLRMDERPDEHRMSWTLVSSSTLTINRGSWRLEALSADRTRVHYENELGARIWVPNSFITALSGVVLPKMLRRWAEYAEAQVRRGEARVA